MFGVPWGCSLVLPAQGVPEGSRGCKSDQNFGFPVDLGVPKYGHAGSRNGVIRCQTTPRRAPAGPASPRLPGLCTWSTLWPTLRQILNVPFNVSKWLPRGCPRGCKGTPPPGGSRGCKSDQNSGFSVDLSVPKYGRAGSRNGVIRCQTTLWSAPAEPVSPRLPGLRAGPRGWDPEGRAQGLGPRGLDTEVGTQRAEPKGWDPEGWIQRLGPRGLDPGGWAMVHQ